MCGGLLQKLIRINCTHSCHNVPLLHANAFSQPSNSTHTSAHALLQTPRPHTNTAQRVNLAHHVNSANKLYNNSQFRNTKTLRVPESTQHTTALPYNLKHRNHPIQWLQTSTLAPRHSHLEHNSTLCSPTGLLQTTLPSPTT